MRKGNMELPILEQGVIRWVLLKLVSVMINDKNMNDIECDRPEFGNSKNKTNSNTLVSFLIVCRLRFFAKMSSYSGIVFG